MVCGWCFTMLKISCIEMRTLVSVLGCGCMALSAPKETWGPSFTSAHWELLKDFYFHVSDREGLVPYKHLLLTIGFFSFPSRAYTDTTGLGMLASLHHLPLFGKTDLWLEQERVFKNQTEASCWFQGQTGLRGWNTIKHFWFEWIDNLCHS